MRQHQRLLVAHLFADQFLGGLRRQDLAVGVRELARVPAQIDLLEVGGEVGDAHQHGLRLGFVIGPRERDVMELDPLGHAVETAIVRVELGQADRVERHLGQVIGGREDRGLGLHFLLFLAEQGRGLAGGHKLAGGAGHRQQMHDPRLVPGEFLELGFRDAVNVQLGLDEILVGRGRRPRAAGVVEGVHDELGHGRFGNLDVVLVQAVNQDEAVAGFPLQAHAAALGLTAIQPDAVAEENGQLRLPGGLDVLLAGDGPSVDRAIVPAHAAPTANARRGREVDHEAHNHRDDDDAPQPGLVLANRANHSLMTKSQRKRPGQNGSNAKDEGFWGSGERVTSRAT